MTLTEWRKRDDHRGAWADFARTEAFKAGMELLRGHARPFVIPGEAADVSAQRQNFQAGFHACVEMLEQIHRLQNKTAQAEIVGEWDWVALNKEKTANA